MTPENRDDDSHNREYDTSRALRRWFDLVGGVGFVRARSHRPLPSAENTKKATYCSSYLINFNRKRAMEYLRGRSAEPRFRSQKVRPPALSSRNVHRNLNRCCDALCRKDRAASCGHRDGSRRDRHSRGIAFADLRGLWLQRDGFRPVRGLSVDLPCGWVLPGISRCKAGIRSVMLPGGELMRSIRTQVPTTQPENCSRSCT